MPTVLLATEGTYPFHGGGVSTWCHVLTNRLSEYDYLALAVIMHPYLQMRYIPPSNVKQVVKVPLWGTEDPAEQRFDVPFSKIFAKRRETIEPIIRRHFLPILEEFLNGLVHQASGIEIGQAVAALAEYFHRYDYLESFRSKVVWEYFQDFCSHWVIQSSGDEPSGLQPTIRDAAECLQLLTRLLQVLDVELPRVDLCHSAAAAVCGLPCVVAKLRDRTPYLLTEHGVYLREQYLNVARTARTPFVKQFLLNFLGAVVRANYCFADLMAPVCHYNARWEMAQGVSPEHIRVVYNGADANRFCPMNLPRRSRPTVTQVGLIFPLKGTKDLITAAAQVRQRIPDVEFLLYGSASDAGYYAECQYRVGQLNLENTVRFAGLTSEPERVYNEADVVTLSSISEGFPYTIVEAMLCGSALVATDVGGVREALDSSGILVPPRQPSSLAEAILHMLENPQLRHQSGQAARHRALEHFSEDYFATQYRQVYQSLIN